MAGGSRTSAHGARNSQSILADVFRRRNRKDCRRLRLPGGAPGASGASGLACDRVHSHEVGYTGDAASYRYFGHLPPVVKGHAGTGREGPGESPAGARPALGRGGKDDPGRIAYAFRLAVARKPSAQELSVLRNLLVQQRVHYRGDKKAALEILGVGESRWDPRLDNGELAAWTMVTSAILNLDEAITKE